MKKLSLWCLTLLLIHTAQAEKGIVFDMPKGGWRKQENSNSQYTQKVQYPASRVNSQDFNQATDLIKGRIMNHPKGEKQPATLIVNGLAMPQYVEESGEFSRPYIFSPGSNSVELRTKEGKRKRVQFYENNFAKTRPKLRILLSWDTNHTDLDLHVVTPDGQHCYYGNRVLKNGGALDVDVTSGYGPEIFSTPTPLPGTYLVYLNYFGGSSEKEITTATITVLTSEGTANEKKRTFRVPMRTAGELTLVSTFKIP